MNRKLLTGLLVLLATVCCPATYITAVAAGSLLANVAGDVQVPEQADIAVHSPTWVTSGEVFVIDIDIENLADRAQRLDSIDLSDEIIDDFSVSSSKPPFKEARQFSGFQSYLFERDIKPGETLSVQLEAMIHDPGAYPLEVDVCINSPTSCLKFTSQIVVRE